MTQQTFANGDTGASVRTKLNANAVDTVLRGKILDLSQRYEKNKRDNARTRAVMATPPAMTFTTAAPSYTQAYPAAPTSLSDFEGYMRHMGGWKFISGGKIYTRAVTGDSTATINRASTANSAGTTFAAEFLVDDVQFSVLINRGSNTATYAPVKVIVDGQYVNATGVSVPDNAFTNGYLNLDFTSAGGRALRHVRVEAASDNAIGYVLTTATGNVVPVTDLKVGPRIMVITDSYGVNGAGPAVDAWPIVMGHFLGCPDIVVNAIGGTGMLVPHGTGHDCFIDRINAGDVQAVTPDFIIISGVSINDSSSIQAGTITRANLQTRIPATLTALRAAAPGVPIMSLGPWTPSSVNATSIGQCDDDMATAVAAQADPLMFACRTYRRNGYNYPTGQIIKPIMWGTGNSSSPNGTGVNDVYTSGDGVHPNPAGHLALARWIAAEFVAGVRAIAT